MSTAARNRKSEVGVPNPLRWHGALAATAAHSVTRLFDSTWRLDLEDASDTLSTIGNQQVIFSLWHNRLLLAPPAYRKYFLARQPHRRLAALVSASKDGAILARVMKYHGIQPVLGSSSRRGAQALRELTTWAKRGYDFAITPDGPRGPRYEVQPGALMLAQISGLPIVPVSATVGWKKEFKSWDVFKLPLPFSHCHIRIGEMVRVPRDADEIEREAARRLLQERMDALTED
ncbi:MAG: lysophospholipid acyltransferase family protein [Verrucomicrobia subdivision 3 bacterium]|nr:lysophospholipid acyltransferase family protein [Limisphaerales bacterium]